MDLNQHSLEVTEEIQFALQQSAPIVALESTIIAHGMPYPQNVETGLEIEALIRKHGGIPATIAIIGGKPKVGLTTDEMEIIGRNHQSVSKASRRDIPYLILKKLHGATTVSATMVIAEQAGIPVFATGGIGGVHRGGDQTFDISADLIELANTNVGVVSAGVKAILDIPKTAEYLETHSVPVIGYQTDIFPAFYTRSSTTNVDFNLASPGEIADFMKLKWKLGLQGGLLIANPIPKPDEMVFQEINVAIDIAIEMANEKRLTGKALTPFLLAEIVKQTGGASLKANIALVKNNAILAAQVAVAYASKH